MREVSVFNRNALRAAAPPAQPSGRAASERANEGQRDKEGGRQTDKAGERQAEKEMTDYLLSDYLLTDYLLTDYLLRFLAFQILFFNSFRVVCFSL